jgi:hypothetical protein
MPPVCSLVDPAHGLLAIGVVSFWLDRKATDVPQDRGLAN